MAAGQQRNQPLLPQAAQALERFKYEVAQEVAKHVGRRSGAVLAAVVQRDKPEATAVTSRRGSGAPWEDIWFGG